MAPPTLVRLTEAAHPHTLARLPVHLGRPDLATFLVTGAGRHGGADYAVGDVVICHEAVRHGDEVILVARGFGRPRLGHVDGLTLIGDLGERCHPGRWRAAGRVAAVLREEREGWVLHLREGTGAMECLALLSVATSPVGAGVEAARPRESAPEVQLGLFERAA